jgi:hypothetical protein
MKTTSVMLNKKDGNAKLISYDKQHCVRLGDTEVLFEGRIYPPSLNASGAEIIAEKLEQEDRVKASKALLREVDGDFDLYTMVRTEMWRLSLPTGKRCGSLK